MDAVYIPTPESGPVGVHAHDGTNWQKLLGNSDGLIKPGRLDHSAYGDGIATLPIASIIDGDGNESLDLIAPFMFNGTTLDRMRNNQEVSLMPDIVRSATHTSSDQTNHNARGVYIMIDIDAQPGAETLTISVQARMLIAAHNLVIATFTAISSEGKFSYIIYPGAVETIGGATLEAQALPLPRTWNINFDHSSSGDWEYSLSYSYIL